VTGAQVRAAWMCCCGAGGAQGIFCLLKTIHVHPLRSNPRTAAVRCSPNKQYCTPPPLPPPPAPALGPGQYCSPPPRSAPPGHRAQRWPCQAQLWLHVEQPARQSGQTNREPLLAQAAIWVQCNEIKYINALSSPRVKRQHPQFIFCARSDSPDG
jgi:hypothetical protein